MEEDRVTGAERPGEEEATDFSFDPGSQREFEVEDTCCVTGEKVSSSFCRFPDFRKGTLMVMSRRAMIEHLRAGTTLRKFREVLVHRYGKEVLKEYAT